jgi:cell division protein FtsB
MKKDKIVMVIVSILCIALAVSLVGTVIYYSGVIAGKNTQISQQETQIAKDQATIASLEKNITILESEIVTLNQTIEELNVNITVWQDKVDELTAIINGVKPSKLKTVIGHMSEKGEGYDWGRTPDVQYTYQKILNHSAPYQVLLLPEYKGNLNWTETYQWIATNFTGIPICLSVFEGGNESLPNPNVKLSIAEIQQAMSACNVRAVRLAEIISWYMFYNLTFPTDYVRGILGFCRSNNLMVLWSEWKIGDNVILPLQEYIRGYEDTVTVLHQTNNQYNEPLEGFTAVSQFQHWGASVQSWYAVERLKLLDEMDMPTSLIIRHAQTATSMGAEVLQFESYRYFFDNGETREIAAALWLAIK